MITTLSEDIDAVLSEGIPLHRSGTNNWALTRDQALSALDSLEQREVVVLGGDIYVEEDGEIRSNHDSWYFETSSNVTHTPHFKVSIDKARAYIASYPLPAAMFALVPSTD